MNVPVSGIAAQRHIILRPAQTSLPQAHHSETALCSFSTPACSRRLRSSAPTMQLTTILARSTLTSFWSWRTFLVTFRFRKQYLAGKFELACFRIDINQLDRNRIAFLQAGLLNGLQTFPIDLGNVKQIILARYKLNERTVRHKRSVIPQP